ncbi:MAG: hypothetical protein ACLUVD_11350 [Mediterraneibacter faecis]
MTQTKQLVNGYLVVIVGGIVILMGSYALGWEKIDGNYYLFDNSVMSY